MRAARNSLRRIAGRLSRRRLCWLLAALALAGCETVQQRGLDPLAASGRLTAAPVSYEALMHIAAAARGGGDLDTAVGIYRRAAELNPVAAAPLVAAGDTLVEMGQINEAIVAYRAALVREPRDPAALRGLARAYLRSGKPELALEPLGRRLRRDARRPETAAADRGRRGFRGPARGGAGSLSPRPRISAGRSRVVGQSGAVAGAVGAIRRSRRGAGPVALGPAGTPGERQNLALIYALQGDSRAAERIARLDLDPQSATRQLAYYDTLRFLSPEARSRAIRSMSANPDGARPPAI